MRNFALEYVGRPLRGRVSRQAKCPLVVNLKCIRGETPVNGEIVGSQ